jgi:hypothetical protein
MSSVEMCTGAVRCTVWVMVDAREAVGRKPDSDELPKPGTPLDVASNDGENTFTRAATPKPAITPSMPPRMPMPTVSERIWRTTMALDQPMARRVPISRIRLATDVRVRSMAMAKTAASTMAARAPPRRSASFLASARLPVTCEERDLLVTTWAPGSSWLISLATVSTSADDEAFTSTWLTRPVLLDSSCSLVRVK